MKILLSPQVRDDNKIWYEIDEEIINVTINGHYDTFDFRGMPDGELSLYDEQGKALIETTLPEVPILNAKRENGELMIEILFSIDVYEKDNRLLFPSWLELHEFKKLMNELISRKKTEVDDVIPVEETKVIKSNVAVADLKDWDDF